MSELMGTVLLGGCSCGCCKQAKRTVVNLLEPELLNRISVLSEAKSVMQAMQENLCKYAYEAEQRSKPPKKTETELLHETMSLRLNDPDHKQRAEILEAFWTYLRVKLGEEKIEPKDGPWDVFFDQNQFTDWRVRGVPIYYKDLQGTTDAREVVYQRLVAAICRYHCAHPAPTVRSWSNHTDTKKWRPEIPPHGRWLEPGETYSAVIPPGFTAKRKWRPAFDPYKDYVEVSRLDDRRVFRVLDYEWRTYPSQNPNEQLYLKLAAPWGTAVIEPFWAKATDFIRTLPMIEEVPNG